jgi:C4-dicarboxylate-specific signal transduction histidine kinase
LPSLRRELLVPFLTILLMGVVLAATAGLLVAPLLPTSQDGVLFVTVVLIADLVVVFLAGHWILRKAVLGPLERMADVAQSIAAGDYRRRMGGAEVVELQALTRSVNAMADRLIEDQELLTDNVRSLDRTNRELVAARDEVIRAARMASVGTLASGLAHEIGNPLGAILTYLDLAKSRARDPDTVTEMVGSARGEALRIDAIVRSLLAYARPSQVESGSFDPWEVATRVQELLTAQGRLDQVAVQWPGSTQALEVQGDRQHLEQILVNLVLNALDVLESVEEPRIAVTLEVVEIRTPRHWFRRESDPPGVDYSHRRRLPAPTRTASPDSIREAERVLVMAVTDNGPGIPAEHLESIFDPFFTTKAPGKGTGLGLAICARLAEGLGGSLEASNNADGGARFTLRIPVEA